VETYVPLSRIPGGIIVGNITGASLAPLRFYSEPEDPETTILGSPPKAPRIGEVTTLRALVGAKNSPTMREAFAA